MNIYPTRHSDIPALETVLDATGLFPSEMLADMFQEHLDNPEPDTLWLTLADPDPIGFCFAQLEPLTEGTWNMKAIAVAPDSQNSGRGTALVEATETALASKAARVLIVDTSGLGEFAATRAFYATRGYETEARIRDFWAAGDDKITFRKAL